MLYVYTDFVKCLSEKITECYDTSMLETGKVKTLIFHLFIYIIQVKKQFPLMLNRVFRRTNKGSQKARKNKSNKKKKPTTNKNTYKLKTTSRQKKNLNQQLKVCEVQTEKIKK